MKTGIRVYDAMTTKPVVISPDKNLVECSELMKSKKIGSLLVKENGRFIGIITEQDIVIRAVAGRLDMLNTTVKRIMSTDVVLASPEMDIFDAIKTMSEYDIRHLPVVDAGKLLGLVTMKDVLKIEPDLFEILVEKFELAEESRKPVHIIGTKEGVCKICGKYAATLKIDDGVLTCKNCR